jgi:hypothetical protein
MNGADKLSDKTNSSKRIAYTRQHQLIFQLYNRLTFILFAIFNVYFSIKKGKLKQKTPRFFQFNLELQQSIHRSNYTHFSFHFSFNPIFFFRFFSLIDSQICIHFISLYFYAYKKVSYGNFMSAPLSN